MVPDDGCRRDVVCDGDHPLPADVAELPRRLRHRTAAVASSAGQAPAFEYAAMA